MAKTPYETLQERGVPMQTFDAPSGDKFYIAMVEGGLRIGLVRASGETSFVMPDAVAHQISYALKKGYGLG